jgi:hypothetical protein
MTNEKNSFVLCSVLSLYVWCINVAICFKANKLSFLPPINEMNLWVRRIWWVTHVPLLVSFGLGVWGWSHFGRYCELHTKEGEKCDHLSYRNEAFLIAASVLETFLIGYFAWRVCRTDSESEQESGHQESNQVQQNKLQISVV